MELIIFNFDSSVTFIYKKNKRKKYSCEFYFKTVCKFILKIKSMHMFTLCIVSVAIHTHIALGFSS